MAGIEEETEGEVMKKFSWNTGKVYWEGFGYKVEDGEPWDFSEHYRPVRKGGHTKHHIINKLKHYMLDKGTARQRKILKGVFGGRKVG